MPQTRTPPHARTATSTPALAHAAPTGQSRFGRILIGATALAAVLSLVTLLTSLATRRPRGQRVEGIAQAADDERTEPTAAARSAVFDRPSSLPRFTNEASSGEPAAPTTGAAPSAPPAPRTPPEAQRLAFATNVFERQTYDRTWADGARRGVEERLQALTDPAARPGKIDCRSTLCRLDVAVSGGPENAEGYLRRAIRGGIWQGEAMYTRTPPDAQGNVTLTMFLAKPGQALPEETLAADGS